MLAVCVLGSLCLFFIGGSAQPSLVRPCLVRPSPAQLLGGNRAFTAQWSQEVPTTLHHQLASTTETVELHNGESARTKVAGEVMEENDRKPWFIRLVEWLVTFPDERRSESGTGDGDDGRDYTDVRRNYQVWNSKSQVFVMGGRFRTLKRSLRGWITFSCCIIPFVLFCIFE